MFFKCKTVPAISATSEIPAAKLWYVRWTARTGPWNRDYRKEVEAFTSKEEAEKVAESLKIAYQLVKQGWQAWNVEMTEA